MATDLADRAYCGPFPELSDEERKRSLADTMRQSRDGAPWVFAYASLMWNPCFSWVRREPLLLDGHRRRFCIWTTRARGTPQCPGIGLGLEAAPSQCKGIAFQLDHRSLDRDLDALWQREMMSGIYSPTWVDTRLGDEAFSVLAFVANPSHPQFICDMSVDDTARMIARASGTYGSCRDYLENTVDELKKLGVSDPELDALRERVATIDN